MDNQDNEIKNLNYQLRRNRVFQRRRNKRHLYEGAGAFLVCLCLFGGIHHIRHQSPSAHPVVSKIAHNVHRKPYINYASYHAPTMAPTQLHVKKMKDQAAIAIDMSTNQILYQHNMHQPRKIASVAKLMTLYLVQRKAKKDHAWSENVPTPQNLRRMSYDKKHGLGGFKFRKGHHYTVRQLYEAAVVESSNNAAIALGEWVANGSNARFIKMMNEQARAWHLRAHFISASGLENDDIKPYGLKVSGGKDDGNEVSALDVGIIAEHLLREYPGITKMSSKFQAKEDGQTLYNVDTLLKGQAFYDSKLHIDGLKSGFTPDAGYCFVGTGKPHRGHRVITVVLHDVQDMKDTQQLMKAIQKQNV